MIIIIHKIMIMIVLTIKTMNISILDITSIPILMTMTGQLIHSDDEYTNESQDDFKNG